jgi:hypothetical protein
VDEPDLMKVDETAQMIKQSPKTLANLRSRGQGLPYVRLPNGQIRYSRKALIAYIEQNTVVPGETA